MSELLTVQREKTPEQLRQEAEARVTATLKASASKRDEAQFRPAANQTTGKFDQELEDLFQSLPETHKFSFIHGSLSAEMVGLHRYKGFVIYREPTHQFWVVLRNGKEWKQGRFLSDREAHKAIDKHELFAERLAIRREA